MTDRNTAIESELAVLVDIHGLSLLDESGRLRRLLAQACPDAPRPVAVIASALSAGVPARLRGAKDDGALPALLQREVDGLQAQGLLDRDWSVWAVRAWAHALALPTGSLDGPGATVAPATRTDAPASPIDAWSARRRDDPVAPARRDPASEPFAPDIESVDGHAMPLVEPLFSEEDLRRIAGSGSEPRLRGTDWTARHEVRTGEGSTAAEVPVRAEPIFAPEDLRAARREQPPDTPSRRRSPRLVIAGLLAIVVGAAGWIAHDPGPGTTPPASTTTPATIPATTGRVEPDAVAANEARDVPTTEPGGGAAAGDAVRTTATPIASATPPAVDPPPPATPESTRMTDPIDPTPESPVAPATVPIETRTVAAAPAIARIEVPAVVEGAPFAVAVHLATDLGQLAAIERRVVESNGRWIRSTAVLPVANLRRDGRDAVLVPFRAMDAPARATVEFTAVSRDGSRSVPKSATIAVAAPTRPGATNAGTASCTSTNCGTVVEAREVEPEIGTRPAVYEMVVRLDDQRTLAFRAPYRFRTGSRVRSSDGRLVPAD